MGKEKKRNSLEFERSKVIPSMTRQRLNKKKMS